MLIGEGNTYHQDNDSQRWSWDYHEDTNIFDPPVRSTQNEVLIRLSLEKLQNDRTMVSLYLYLDLTFISYVEWWN